MPRPNRTPARRRDAPMTAPGVASTAVDPTSTPAVAFEHVSKVFRDGTHAVDDVTLRAAPGEFVAIVGPSGCGKSTLLRIAAGLSVATAGSVHAPADDIGYVFQDATLLPWRTVQRNVELPAQIRGLPRCRAPGPRPRRPRAHRVSRASSTIAHAPCRVGCACACRSPGRSPCDRRCSCSTSPSAPSTRSPVNASTTSCCASSCTSTSPPCSSPTRSPRRCTWQPGSW